MIKHICLISYGGGHAAMLVPIIKELQKNKDYKLTVLALTTAGSVMKRNNIEYVGYQDFTYLAPQNFNHVGQAIVGESCASDVVPYAESVAYHGINYLDLKEQYGDKEAHMRYDKLGRQVFYPINFMKRLLKTLNIDLLVSTNSPRSEKAAIDAAGLLGINSICMVDLFALQEIKWIGLKGYASKVCVLNQTVKQMFVNHGRKDSDIFITGNPAFDSLSSSATIKGGKKIITVRDRGSEGIVTLLYASQPEPKIHPFNGTKGDETLPQRIESELRSLVKNNAGFRLVVRYHPSQNVDFIPQERVSPSYQTENVQELLHAVDIVVVTTSTVGLEAHLIGKPVVSIDTSIFTADAPYSRMGISTGVPSIDRLAEAIKTIAAKLHEYKNKKIELKATQKVLGVISNTINDLEV